jgi:hypothetical protein
MDYQVIATQALELRSADGATVPVEVRIGAPYEEDRSWACPLELVGLRPRLPDIRGESAIQALGLALGMARTLVVDAIENGRELCFVGDPDLLTADDVRILFGAPPSA